MSRRMLATNAVGKLGISTGHSFGSWTEREVAARDWERQHEMEWVRIDQKLRGIATRRAALDAEEARLLRYAEELKLWRGWGFGSMCEYMERAMGYAPHTASERLRVARALGELPLIAEALEQGALMHSAVRELSRVAIPETEDAWLEARAVRACARSKPWSPVTSRAISQPMRPSRGYTAGRSLLRYHPRLTISGGGCTRLPLRSMGSGFQTTS